MCLVQGQNLAHCAVSSDVTVKYRTTEAFRRSLTSAKSIGLKLTRGSKRSSFSFGESLDRGDAAKWRNSAEQVQGQATGDAGLVFHPVHQNVLTCPGCNGTTVITSDKLQ